ncbi:MAG: TPR domain protein, putative component of TonB system [Rhodanobacteraceae bacterium]|jgi:predicted O-linked N-acetylglucosamine transferase (SPINDLY family)|nr:MAG: TPR domain protein, putative component of TonB system [Rhodanobacteraceae bacterium]
MNAPGPDDLDARLARILGKVGPAAAPPVPAAPVPPAAPQPNIIPAVLETRFAQIAELLERGDAAAAEPLARDLRSACPGVAEAARMHGIALLMLGRPEEARATLQEAVRLAPGEYLARCNHAAALMACGESDAAIGILQQVVRERPGDAGVHNNLANALRSIGDDARARDEYLAALEAVPDHPGATLNLAAVELALGMLDDAEQRLRAMLDRQPHPQAWLLLGNVLSARRDFAGAEAAYLAGARLAPGAAEFPYQAGLMADEQCRYADAAAFYRRALQLDPELQLAESQLLFVLRRLYDWAGAAPLSARQRARVVRGEGNGDIDPFAFLAEDATPAEQLVCAQMRAARVVRAQQPLQGRLRFQHPPRADSTPLRVGFVSAGFGARAGVPHATALLTAAFFEELGKLDGLEVNLFATTSDPGSPIRERLRAAAHGFHETDALPVPDLAQRIHQTRIDILVDVDGWCAGAVPGVFALKPAPVQVNWLAYPGSSGAPYMDYIVADRFIIPESSRRFYSEAVAWLPRCYQPSDTTRLLFDAPPRASFGLPPDAVVFASFNNAWKLNAASFARMCAVLRETPGSVLWLLSAGRDADARLRDAARKHGIDPKWLVFSPSLPHLQHLARYRLADLFLDTHPYNAHTTASDAIWAGCPVLTRPGETFASRVAGSLNHYLGIPELNARDDESFVATAVRLGNDRNALVRLRARLEAQRDTSGLFDMEVYAHDFAALLREMDDRHRRGQPPKHITPQEPTRTLG